MASLSGEDDPIARTYSSTVILMAAQRAHLEGANLWTDSDGTSRFRPVRWAILLPHQGEPCMASIDDIELDRLAVGIRYDTHFRVEDRLGEIVDSVLATERQDVSRFPQIGYGAGTRQLSNEISSESLTFTRSDTIYDNRKASLHVADISKLANEFFDDVWGDRK